MVESLYVLHLAPRNETKFLDSLFQSLTGFCSSRAKFRMPKPRISDSKKNSHLYLVNADYLKRGDQSSKCDSQDIDIRRQSCSPGAQLWAPVPNDMRFPTQETHISNDMCSLVGKHISLGICAQGNTYNRGTYITATS